MSSVLIHGAALWSHGRRIPGDSLAINEGTIIAIGSRTEVAEAAGTGAEPVDAHGGLVSPGFVDAHVHLGIVAGDSLRCDLSGASSIAEIDERITAFAGRTSASWLIGGGWDRALFPTTGPTAHHLDALVADRPALFYDADHHAGWVNSLALARAGIDRTTPDPSDGRLGRLADGTPSGFLAEGALQLLSPVLPAPDPDELGHAIIDASRQLLAAGVTGWQEAALGAFAGFPDFTAAYRRAMASGDFLGRPTGALWIPRDLTVDGIDDFVDECRSRAADNATWGFTTTTAKLMLDGVLETQTAAVLDPYCGSGGGAGLSYFDPEIIQHVIPALNAAGFSVHVHAIGDRAVRDALDGFSRVPPDHRARVRNHIAHLELIADEDVPRFAETGTTANLQPYWAARTPLVEQVTEPLLGSPRADRLFPFAALHATGASLAMGSDWPVSRFEPWLGIHTAVTRRSPGDDTTEPLGAHQSLPLTTALTAYTEGSATLLGIAGSGRLEVGAPADLVVADRNPLDHPSSEIHLTRPVLTFVGGVVAFDADRDAP